jgi:endonuclease YncB( thermonuclease family)
MFTYRVAEVLGVVDGDTIDCRVALGFGLTAAFRFRLAAIDTPEMFGQHAEARGAAAAAFTKKWLADHPQLTVRTFKGAESTVGIGDGAFGRWLAAFVAPDGSDLAAALRSAGHVKGVTVR